jgi:hypothetical protein
VGGLWHCFTNIKTPSFSVPSGDCTPRSEPSTSQATWGSGLCSLERRSLPGMETIYSTYIVSWLYETNIDKLFFFRACVETKCWWLCFELGPSKCHMNPSKFPHVPSLKWFTIFLYYGHLLVTSGYKWDYTFYKWCFVGTYNWHNSGHNCTRSCAQSPQKNGTGGNISFHCWIHRHHPAQIPFRILNSPTWLVDGWPTPLKNDGVRQLGWRTSQLNGRIKIIFQTTNQMSVTMNRSNTKPGLLEGYSLLGTRVVCRFRESKNTFHTHFGTASRSNLQGGYSCSPCDVPKLQPENHRCFVVGTPPTWSFKPDSYWRHATPMYLQTRAAVALKIDPTALHGIFQSCWADSVWR